MLSFALRGGAGWTFYCPVCTTSYSIPISKLATLQSADQQGKHTCKHSNVNVNCRRLQPPVNQRQALTLSLLLLSCAIPHHCAGSGVSEMDSWL